MTDSNVKYLNLRKLFNSAIFRIPDYQRGYAWEDKHFDALWNDLRNIQRGKLDYHYTGMITVERIKRDLYEAWEDHFYFKRNDGYFVIDGQQRLTTITILLFELLEAYFSDNNTYSDKLVGVGKARWFKDYLIRQEEDQPPSFIFGYHTDNPSDLFFKAAILEHPLYRPTSGALEQTAYTNQLIAAKLFFKKKIQRFLHEEAQKSTQEDAYRQLEELCDLLTERMMFDFKILDDALDIFMVFETMNTRGKGLSNLEKLKNRLIYLATLLHKMDSSEEEDTDNDLRRYIVGEWKEVYKELGRSKTLLNTDDTLLNYHWIMYDSYDRTRAQAYAEDLFESKFTVNNVVSHKVNEDLIRHYVDSLVQSTRWWYVISKPNDDFARMHTDDTVLSHTLVRINRMGHRYFVPLLFAVLQAQVSIEQKRLLVQQIERYIFLIFTLSSRRANTGRSHFFSLASSFYQPDQPQDVEYVIDNLEEWISGGEGYLGYFRWSYFKQYLEPLFDNFDGGYRKWSGLKYFLSEYESQEVPLEDYSQYQVVPIFQLKGASFSSKAIKGFSKKELKYLEMSLGNYLLVKKAPQNWSTFSFEEIKAHLQAQQPESDVLAYAEWTPQAIAQRGKQMLQFLEQRWKIQASQQLTEAQQLDLLYLNFMNELSK